jgi:DNA-binding transcriptional MerR regulator
VKALRQYDEIGLLVPARVDPDNGYRYYDAAQVEAAVTIRRLRALELPLDEIGALLDADGVMLRDRLAAHGYRDAEEVRDKHSLLIELGALVEGGGEQVVVEVHDVRALLLAGFASQEAQAKTSVAFDPFDFTVMICNGDLVHVTGTDVTAFDGNTLTSAHSQDLTGVDLTTGTVYHGEKTYFDIVPSQPAGNVETFSQDLRLVAAGGQSFTAATLSPSPERASSRPNAPRRAASQGSASIRRRCRLSRRRPQLLESPGERREIVMLARQRERISRRSGPGRSRTSARGFEVRRSIR